MEGKLTGIKDVDKLILENLDDEELLRVISLNKYLNTVADENFWRKRLLQRYPNVEIDKTRTWKDNYLKILYYVDKIKREFDFTFTKGNPKKYYEILRYWILENYGRRLTATAERMLLEKGYDDILLFMLIRSEGHITDSEWDVFKQDLYKGNKYKSGHTMFLEKII